MLDIFKSKNVDVPRRWILLVSTNRYDFEYWNVARCSNSVQMELKYSHKQGRTLNENVENADLFVRVDKWVSWGQHAIIHIQNSVNVEHFKGMLLIVISDKYCHQFLMWQIESLWMVNPFNMPSYKTSFTRSVWHRSSSSDLFYLKILKVCSP